MTKDKVTKALGFKIVDYNDPSSKELGKRFLSVLTLFIVTLVSSNSKT